MGAVEEEGGVLGAVGVEEGGVGFYEVGVGEVGEDFFDGGVGGGDEFVGHGFAGEDLADEDGGVYVWVCGADLIED